MTARTPFIGDPFAELGVSGTASRDEVRHAFRRRARETHPDHQPGDPLAAKRFSRLRIAYEEALKRIKAREQGDSERQAGQERPHSRRHNSGENVRGRILTENELLARAHSVNDPGALRRMFHRHGHRSLIGAALACNPHFPTDILQPLRLVTENHWTVETAIANRTDVSEVMLTDIARLARETVTGMAIAKNTRSTGEILDALVQGPVRLDAALENILAGHPSLSKAAATRLASRHATNVTAIVRLIDRGDLPEELLLRLATQVARLTVASAAQRDLTRRGRPLPPMRTPQRPPKTLTGSWR